MVERQALVDGLTGLANRRHLDQELAAQPRPRRAGRRLASRSILADLDDFKARQRRARPCLRRHGPARVRRADERGRARGRHRRALGRRGVRAAPAGHRRSTARSGSPSGSAPALEEQVILSPGGRAAARDRQPRRRRRSRTRKAAPSSSPPPTRRSTAPSAPARTASSRPRRTSPRDRNGPRAAETRARCARLPRRTHAPVPDQEAAYAG